MLGSSHRLRRLVIAAPLVLGSIGHAQLNDGFESYASGPVCGHGGWAQWYSSTDVCGSVTTERAHSGTRSLKIVGNVGGSTGQGDDTVEQMDLVGGRWILDAWTYVPSDATGRAFIVLLNSYPANLNWSLDLEFNADEGIVRDYDNPSAQVPLVRGQWVLARADIDLDRDVYNVYYGDAHVVVGKSWINGASHNGQPRLQCVDLYADEPAPGHGTSGMYFDDVRITRYNEAGCPCDWNRDGTINSQDFFSFLVDLFALNADFNNDSQTNSQDFFDFLACFFQGCAPPLTIDAGHELLHTAGGVGMVQFPPGFFGPGSDPFTGQMQLRSAPLGTRGPFELGTTDTVISRRSDLSLLNPPSTASVPIELVELSLVSVQPIRVTYNGGQRPEMWNVSASLDPAGSSAGHMDLHRTTTQGGTASGALDFHVNWQVSLGSQTRTMPAGTVSVTVNGTWACESEGCTSSGLQIPDVMPMPLCWSSMLLVSPELSVSLATALADPARPPATVMPGAVVDPNVGSLGRFAVISPGAVIGAGAVIGPRAVIGPGAVIGPNAIIGADCGVGVDVVVERGVCVTDHCTIRDRAAIGADSVLSPECDLGTDCVIGAGTYLGSRSIIGAGTRLGFRNRTEDDVAFGVGVTTNDDLVFLTGAVIPASSTQAQSHLQCRLPGGTMLILPISACEALGGAVRGIIPGGEGLNNNVATGVVSEPFILWDPIFPPIGLEFLQNAVDNARNGAGEIIKDKPYVPTTYDCDDFAGEMEQALEAMGYHATFTVVWEFEPNPARLWYHGRWLYSNKVLHCHALTDIHINGEIVFVEPQTGEIGIDMDYDGDGDVDYASSHAGFPARTDGNARIEVYESRAAAKAAGVVMD